MTFISETWAERHIFDIARKELCQTRPVRRRIDRLNDLEKTRKAIMNFKMPLNERLTKLNLLREALNKL